LFQSQYIINQKNSNVCPECNSNLIQNGHENVCENCGLVIDSVLFVDSFQFNDTINSDLSTGDQFVSVGQQKYFVIINVKQFLQIFKRDSEN